MQLSCQSLTARNGRDLKGPRSKPQQYSCSRRQQLHNGAAIDGLPSISRRLQPAPLRPDIVVDLIRVEQPAVEEAVRAEGQCCAAGADGRGRRKGAFDLRVGGRKGGSER